jgi:hypothetical protein
MLLLSVSAFATGNGDYCVHINNGIATYYDDALIGFTNTLEIWIENDDLLGGMSPAIEIVIDDAFNWETWGAFPPADPVVQEENDAVGVWNLPDLQVANDFDDASPEHLLLGGAAMPGAGLPANTSRLCYTLQFTISGAATEHFPGIHISPYVYPPAGTWTFTDGAGGYPPTFCGADAGTETNPVGLVEFDIIELPCLPPVWVDTPPPVVDQNHCDDYTYQLDATEGGNVPAADPVTYGGDFTNPDGFIFRPFPCSMFVEPLEVWAMNACGGQVFYNFEIHWFSNPPQITNCPPITSVGKIAKCNTWTYNFDVVDPDPCDIFTWTVECADIPCATCPCEPFGAYGIDNLGNFWFNTADEDGGCIYGFRVCVYDKTGLVDCCEFQVEVLATEPFVIRINKVHEVLQGHYVFVCIGQPAGSELIGGFDFLIAYDASALTFISAELGDALKAQGWEYFTYRYGPWGNCTGPCPSGFARFVAIADINNGPNHPTGYGGGGQYVDMKFYVTNDRTFECQYVPIRFVWQDCGDCGDNGLSSVTGDTLFIMERVFDFEWNSGWQCGDPIDFGDESYELTWVDADLGFGFMYGGPDPECTVCVEFYPPDHPTHPGECKNKPVQFIWFWNGGVDIACAESIDARGDINMNGIAHEIADAVLFTNYFLYGIGVFHIAMEGQIAATDVNNDGIVLSVGDLVYLIRVITGDALPFPKLAPFANSVDVNVVNGLLSANSASDIGGVYAVFEFDGSYEIVNHTDMELVSHGENGELRVLLYSGLDDMSNFIPAGENQLFTVVGGDLIKAEVSDFNGNLLTTNVQKTALPTAFNLQQNVPNPFNPTTRITLELPELSNWNLDIYNVAGQLVKSFNGNDIGVVTVEWNAANLASGVYFYRMTAGAFTDTKKMVLMK